MSDACSNPDQLPEEAWIVALLSLPGLGPSRLRLLLEAHGARGAWDRLCRGDRVTVESVGPIRSRDGVAPHVSCLFVATGRRSAALGYRLRRTGRCTTRHASTKTSSRHACSSRSVARCRRVLPSELLVRATARHMDNAVRSNLVQRSLPSACAWCRASPSGSTRRLIAAR